MPISRRLPAITITMAGIIAVMGTVLYLQSYRHALSEIETNLGPAIAAELKKALVDLALLVPY